MHIYSGVCSLEAAKNGKVYSSVLAAGVRRPVNTLVRCYLTNLIMPVFGCGIN